MRDVFVVMDQVTPARTLTTHGTDCAVVVRATGSATAILGRASATESSPRTVTRSPMFASMPAPA